jgi:hypothetical protein
VILRHNLFKVHYGTLQVATSEFINLLRLICKVKKNTGICLTRLLAVLYLRDRFVPGVRLDALPTVGWLNAVQPWSPGSALAAAAAFMR